MRVIENRQEVKNVKHVKVLEDQRVHGKVGRPKAITKEQVLKAIEMHATDSPTELGKILNVTPKTVLKRIREVSRKQIDRILMTLADSTLTPAEMDYNVFEQIPIVQRYRELLTYNRKVTHGYVKQRIRSLHKLCCVLKLHPMHLNPEHIEECTVLVAKVERGEIKTQTRYGVQRMGVDSTKKTFRSWFQLMHALSGEYLTIKGIPSNIQEPKRSRARLTPEHRKAFMRVLEEKTRENWTCKKGAERGSIKFGDDPELRARMLLLPKAYYYWGSRKKATLQARIQEMQWHNPIAVQMVIDKGGIEWKKRTAGEFLTEFRKLHETLGRPRTGLWFPFNGSVVGELFKECYEEAEIPENLWRGMPFHIWRHTAAQDLLEATNYNYELVAEILGWISVDMLKKYYGRIGDDTVDKGFAQAIGMPVQWKRREFKF